MTSAAFAFFVAPVALMTEDATLRSAITPCPLFPVQEEVGVRLEQTEIRHLTSQLGWTNPVGLLGYSRNGYYKDLWLYFNRADTTSTVNEMADRAFRMYGLGGAQVFQKPTFKPIRGVVIVMRLEPDPNFCPPPPFKYQPALALEDVYDTLGKLPEVFADPSGPVAWDLANPRFPVKKGGIWAKFEAQPASEDQFGRAMTALDIDSLHPPL